MNFVRSARCGAALVFSLFLGVSLFAQSDNTSVTGTVRDPSGATISNAKIVLRNDNTGAVREATSTGSGIYVIPSIPSGTYTLTVEVDGFKKFESRGNKVDANLPATIDAVLTVGAVSETVTVEGSIGGIQTETSTLGKLVEGKQLTDLQLNGRNPIFLAALKPGVRGGNSLANFSFGLSTGGFSINGSRSQDNLITFDGAVGIRTRANGDSIGTADLDSVQEVQVLTSNYSAEYGRSAGGQIRIITKSGSQQFHGAIFENLRNEKLDANTWANNRVGTPRQPNKFNQFGWNFSGPVFIPGLWNQDRSKLFFFVGQEWVRRRAVSSNFRTVPTLQMRQGNFSELLGPNIFYRDGRVITDPTTGNPFPNNIVPSSRLSQNGMGLMSVFPEPNLAVPQGSSNWYGIAGQPTNQRKDTVAVDFLPTSKDSFKFRLSMFHFNEIQPFQTNYLISGRVFDRPNESASLNWTRTINSTTVNEFLITASADHVNIGMEDTRAFDRTTYGINYPYIFPNGKDRFNKLPTIDINAFNGYTGTPYPSRSAGPIYNISNNTTKILGSHTLKFGVLWERAGQNDYDQINITGVPGGSDNQNGRFEFRDARPGGTGTAIADMALGLASNYAEIGTRSYTPYRGNMVEFFIHDGWKVTNKLKLELGVRGSIMQPYYSLWGNMALFDPRYYDPSKAVQVNPTTGNPIPNSGDAYNGIVIPGSSWPDAAKGRVPIATTGEFNHLFRGEPRHYSNINTIWQPRVGMAYQIGSKTVVRSGIGRFSTRNAVSDSTFLGGNPPLQPMASIPTTSVDMPGGGSLASFPVSVTSQDKIYKIPESWNWNVTVERELAQNTVLEVSYVGRKGLHLVRERNINQLQPGTIQANPGINANYLRPYKGYGPIRLSNTDASSFYQGLQIGLNRRFSKGLGFGFAYTYSKSQDSGSGPKDLIPDAYDASSYWGPSDFDNRHVAVVNYIYELPFFRDTTAFTGKVLGGWQISGVTQFQTGRPYSPATGDDFAGVGPGSGNQFWQISDLTYQNQFTANPGDGNRWLTATVQRPVAGTFAPGNMRNILRGPGFQNWNISLIKNFRVTERVNIQFRADGFNFINRPNWGGANGDASEANGGLVRNPNSGSFGLVAGKGGERNLQFGLRLAF